MLPTLPTPPRWPGFRIGNLRFHRVHQDDLGDTPIKPILCVHHHWRNTAYRVLCLWWVGWRLRWFRGPSLREFENSAAGKVAAWGSCTAPPSRSEAGTTGQQGESLAAEENRLRFERICRVIRGEASQENHAVVLVTNISACARCGGTHERMQAQPLANPPAFCDLYAICPTTNQPIMIQSASFAASDPPADVRAAQRGTERTEHFYWGPGAVKRWESRPSAGAIPGDAAAPPSELTEPEQP